MSVIVAPRQTRRRHPDYRLDTDEELRRWYRYFHRRFASVDEDITDPLDTVDILPNGSVSAERWLRLLGERGQGEITVAELRRNAREYFRLHHDAIVAEMRRRVRLARLGLPFDCDTYSRDFLDDLKRRVALDELFEYELGVTLGRPNGKGVRRGPCPFCKTGPHSQALMVSIGDHENQFFYCHACHASGDAIDAIAAAYGLTFTEAVRRLAANGNIPMPSRGGVR